MDVTGNDHNTDAIIAALRSPALPAEQVGEAAAVTAMVEAHSTVGASVAARRPRRGIAIAAVTVASLGIGGLAAAGPGIFQIAADEPDLPPTQVRFAADDDDESTTDDESTDDEARDESRGTSAAAGVAQFGEETTDASQVADDIECADGSHGATVSSVAQSTDNDGEVPKGQTVREAAQSGCGKPERTDDPPADVPNEAPGRSGEAPGRTGSTPGQSGNTPGQSGNTPAQGGEAPGQSGQNPGQSGQNPGQSGQNPGQSGQDPGQSGQTSGQPGDSTGKSGDAPGQADTDPGKSGDAPGQSGGNQSQGGGNQGNSPDKQP